MPYPQNTDDTLSGELLAFVERMEQLDEEAKQIAEAKKELRAELKGRGYDVKVFAAVMKRRKADPDDIKEFEAILETYLAAIGM